MDLRLFTQAKSCVNCVHSGYKYYPPTMDDPGDEVYGCNLPHARALYWEDDSFWDDSFTDEQWAELTAIRCNFYELETRPDDPTKPLIPLNWGIFCDC